MLMMVGEELLQGLQEPGAHRLITAADGFAQGLHMGRGDAGVDDCANVDGLRPLQREAVVVEVITERMAHVFNLLRISAAVGMAAGRFKVERRPPGTDGLSCSYTSTMIACASGGRL